MFFCFSIKHHILWEKKLTCKIFFFFHFFFFFLPTFYSFYTFFHFIASSSSPPFQSFSLNFFRQFSLPENFWIVWCLTLTLSVFTLENNFWYSQHFLFSLLLKMSWGKRKTLFSWHEDWIFSLMKMRKMRKGWIMNHEIKMAQKYDLLSGSEIVDSIKFSSTFLLNFRLQFFFFSLP